MIMSWTGMVERRLAACPPGLSRRLGSKRKYVPGFQLRMTSLPCLPGMNPRSVRQAISVTFAIEDEPARATGS
jgi:hypothetical protein